MADFWETFEDDQKEEGFAPQNYFFDSSEEDEEEDEEEVVEAGIEAGPSKEPHHGSLLDRILRFLPRFQIPYDQATYNIDELCGWFDEGTGEWVNGTAQTGDILLMAGDDASSNAVQLFTPSDFSHVALIVVHGSQVYLFESVRVRDSISSYRVDGEKEYNVGVRVVLLRDKLENYHGHAIAVRHLSCVNEETERAIREHLNSTLQKAQSMYIGMPYDSQPLDFINVKLWFWSSPRTDADPKKKYKHGLFCSSLVAEVFLMAGMVPGHLSQEATCYSPESFSDTGEFYPVFPECLLSPNSKTGPRILEQLGSMAGYETNQLVAYTPELMVKLPNAIDTPTQCLRRWWNGGIRASDARYRETSGVLPTHRCSNKTD